MSSVFAETVSVLSTLLGVSQYVAAFIAVRGLARLSLLMASRALS